jgi:hypothetical protein
MNLFLIVRYQSIVKQCSVEKKFCFSFEELNTLEWWCASYNYNLVWIYLYICLLIERVMCNDFILILFLPLTWNMRRESNRLIVTLPFSFSISSHLYSIQFISNDLMRSFRNGAIVYIEILFNHARDCDRAERNNRWNSSN